MCDVNALEQNFTLKFHQNFPTQVRSLTFDWITVLCNKQINLKDKWFPRLFKILNVAFLRR